MLLVQTIATVCRCFLFWTISKLWNWTHPTCRSVNQKLSRATDRNWRCSLRRRKCLTASFSHWRPSDKMVDTSFLLTGFGWWKDAESNRLGWWVDSPDQLADYLVEFKEKLDVNIHHSIQGWLDMSYGTGPSILGPKLPASHRYWKFHTWSFQDSSTRSESWIDSWQETTTYQGVEWAA